MADEYRILLSKQAAKDLQRIFGYIAGQSPDAAAALVGKVLGSVENLQIFPHRTVVDGQSERVPHPVRSLPCGSYMVYFRVLDSQRVVRIVRVRHGARRPLRRYPR
jgi:plasmid stabilization system protein ParE